MKISREDALRYEIASSLWVNLLPVRLPDWLCSLAASWYVLKTKLKYARYEDLDRIERDMILRGKLKRWII